MNRRILFIDRDGTLIVEPPVTFQVDTLEQLELLPGIIRNLYRLQHELGYELVMVTNQDGLGTASYPQEHFDLVQAKLLQLLAGEDITFSAIHVDRSFPHEGLDTRKPGIGMLRGYMDGSCALPQSFVIGDRQTDVQLGAALRCGSILMNNSDDQSEWPNLPTLTAAHWDDIYSFLRRNQRSVSRSRTTSETDVRITLNPDGDGTHEIATGLHFFDHMLAQLARHSKTDISLSVKGDVQVDEHHTIEDTAIVLGEAFGEALGDKRGLARYGFALPMDDCLAQVAIDFGGRPWLVWDVQFTREYVGDMPTEMVMHFFKSFSDAARCSLNIKAEGENNHHKMESIFKAFAKAVRMAVATDPRDRSLPTTKGTL